MSVQKRQVSRFYEVLWNAQDMSGIDSVLHEDFTFRGSLGQETRGHQGFIEYVQMVHQAFGAYQCLIEDLVAEGAKVFARMTFTGIHQGKLMGHAPTMKRVRWAGCALFRFDGERIADVWVLGDLKELEAQLTGNST